METRKEKNINLVNNILMTCLDYMAGHYDLVSQDKHCINCGAGLMCLWRVYDFRDIENDLDLEEEERVSEEEQSIGLNLRVGDSCYIYKTKSGRLRVKKSYLIDYKKNIGDMQRIKNEKNSIKAGLGALGIKVYRCMIKTMNCPRGKGLNIDLIIEVCD